VVNHFDSGRLLGGSLCRFASVEIIRERIVVGSVVTHNSSDLNCLG